VVLQDVTGLAEKVGTVQLDQGILEETEASHAICRTDGVSETAVIL
jgi:hypothetical protein